MSYIVKHEFSEKLIMEKHNKALSVISHDLKSPMIAIVGFSEILLREVKKSYAEPRWIKMLERINKTGRDVERLIEDIMSMVKIEAGKEKIEPEWVPNLSDELMEVKNTFHCEAKAKGIFLSLEIPGPLPPVRWDMSRIRYHVLNNLVSNALKFTPEGGSIMINAKSSTDTVLLKVIDTGAGIPEKEQEKIFHRFEQMELRTERVFKGAGLGLYNAHMFVTRHGGKISIDNTVCQGTTFLMELPIDSLLQPVLGGGQWHSLKE